MKSKHNKQLWRMWNIFVDIKWNKESQGMQTRMMEPDCSERNILWVDAWERQSSIPRALPPYKKDTEIDPKRMIHFSSSGYCNTSKSAMTGILSGNWSPAVANTFNARNCKEYHWISKSNLRNSIVQSSIFSPSLSRHETVKERTPHAILAIADIAIDDKELWWQWWWRLECW